MLNNPKFWLTASPTISIFMLGVAVLMAYQGHWGTAGLDLFASGMWVACWIIWYKIKKQRER